MESYNGKCRGCKDPRVVKGVLFIVFGIMALLYAFGLLERVGTAMLICVAIALVVKGLVEMGVWPWPKKQQ